MTKKQLKALEKTGTTVLAELLAGMTAVLAKNGIRDMQVVTFEMAPTPPPKPPVNNTMTIASENSKPPGRGCVLLPDGTIFCG